MRRVSYCIALLCAVGHSCGPKGTVERGMAGMGPGRGTTTGFLSKAP